MESISVFIDIKKFLISSEKVLTSAELKGCVTWFISFLDLVYVRYNCAKFLYCKICATDFIKEGFFRPPIHEQQRNGPSGIGTRSLLDFSDKQESFLYIFNNTVYDYLLVKCGSFHLFLISHNPVTTHQTFS